MRRTAKIFMNNRSNASEVFIRKEGNDLILSPRPLDWSSYLAEGAVASKTLMEGVEDLPIQEREP